MTSSYDLTLFEYCTYAVFTVRELFFDISGFNSKTIRISEFVKSLVLHHDPDKPPLYEGTIRYAEFPALDLREEDRESFSYNKEFIAPHTEVFEVLSWLEEKKKVKSILKLRVQDRLINPHDEQQIWKKVQFFEVELLDWKILDLSIPKFDEGVKPTIKDLHLYSSGKRAVIRHWLGNEGIQNLPMVCYIYPQYY